ncbi:MAG: transposase [Bacteroidia bacterium]|nr:transposase [Bacteroidia bacterium]
MKHFVTSTVVDWIDVFTRREYCEILTGALEFARQSRGLRIHAYVIMPSYLQMLVSSPEEKLSNVMRDFKQFTSRSIVHAVQDMPENRSDWLTLHFRQHAAQHPKIRHAQFWQAGYQPQVCYSVEGIRQKIHDIHEAPVKAGTVHEPWQYVWSSARDYAGLKGPLTVDKLL